MSETFLQAIRERELCYVAHEFRPGERVLELGAGSGWQARLLAARGLQVAAIDVPGARLAANRVWPVVEYDGARIPFADASFDVIFSSNVLEHILWLEPFQDELRRVLKPGGRAVHIVPGSGWRFWTNLTHYCHAIKLGTALVARRLLPTRVPAPASQELVKPLARIEGWELIKQALIPCRHGETGNAFSELYYFSRLRWNRLFLRTGWNLRRRYSNSLWYSGYLCLGERLSLETRRRLSRLLGGVCHIYVLEASDHIH